MPQKRTFTKKPKPKPKRTFAKRYVAPKAPLRAPKVPNSNMKQLTRAVSNDRSLAGDVLKYVKIALDGAVEIKRFLNILAPQALDSGATDASASPDYIRNVGAVAWAIRPIQELLTQGTAEDERVGNIIRPRGLKYKEILINRDPDQPQNTNEETAVRTLIIKCRNNFLLDASTSDIPLPQDFLTWCRLKDVSVLRDRITTLSPTNVAGFIKEWDDYIELKGETSFLDDGNLKPEKGIIYVCHAALSQKQTYYWAAELTYSDVM